MNTAEVKLHLFQLINNTNDPSLLDKAYTTLSKLLSKKETDWWDTISAEERAGIEEGIAQADRGELIPHEKAMKIIKTRLKR